MLSSPSLTQVLDQIRTAIAERTPLQIRGGGSKDFLGQIQPAQLLDTQGLHGIVDYAPSELVVTVGAGTRLTELEAVLAEKGQCLPFEPPHFGWSSGAASPSTATVGGMVASGLAGPARASVGSVRDYVLGLKLISGRGEHLTFGGQVMKNVAGYDVSRLMVGAMGTLGVITEVSLKVLPVAPAEATLVFPLEQTMALEQLHRWGGEPLPLNASCWVRDSTAPQGAQDLLFVRLRGAAAAVEAASRKMLADVPGQRMDTAQAAGDWGLCRNQRLDFFQRPLAADLALWRLSVAPTSPVLELPWPQLLEWHGGLRWLWAPLQAGPQLQEIARAASGTATVFIAASAKSTRARGQFGTKLSAAEAIAQRTKAAFDPLGLFNPGRLSCRY